MQGNLIRFSAYREGFHPDTVTQKGTNQDEETHHLHSQNRRSWIHHSKPGNLQTPMLRLRTRPPSRHRGSRHGERDASRVRCHKRQSSYFPTQEETVSCAQSIGTGVKSGKVSYRESRKFFQNTGYYRITTPNPLPSPYPATPGPVRHRVEPVPVPALVMLPSAYAVAVSTAGRGYACSPSGGISGLPASISDGNQRQTTEKSGRLPHSITSYNLRNAKRIRESPMT